MPLYVFNLPSRRVIGTVSGAFLLVVLLSSIAAIWLFSTTQHAKQKHTYNGYRLVRVIPQTETQLRYLYAMENQNQGPEELDFWIAPANVGMSVDILAPPTRFTDLMQEFTVRGLAPQVLIENMQSKLDETVQHPILDKHVFNDDGFSFGSYHTYIEIKNFLLELEQNFPYLVKVDSIGRSIEGRSLDIIKIGNHSRVDDSRPSIWIDAGIHAREWIAPATAIYIIDRLVSEWFLDQRFLESRAPFQSFDWYILPIMNPDGYVYSWDEDRLWRKNRNLNSWSVWGCKGVDLNRNFDHAFGGISSSNHPCSQQYRGKEAFSEPESLSVRDFLMHKRKNMMAYFTMHAYGLFWGYPWGFKKEHYPPDVDKLKQVADKAVTAILQVSDYNFKTGTPADFFYAAGGCSDDWAKAVPQIPYVFLTELPPCASCSTPGFMLPEKEILPVGHAMWTGLKAAIKKIAQLENISDDNHQTTTTEEPTKPKPTPLPKPSTPETTQLEIETSTTTSSPCKQNTTKVTSAEVEEELFQILDTTSTSVEITPAFLTLPPTPETTPKPEDPALFEIKTILEATTTLPEPTKNLDPEIFVETQTTSTAAEPEPEPEPDPDVRDFSSTPEPEPEPDPGIRDVSSTPESSSGCEDKYLFCYSYSMIGLCGDNFVANNCAKSCNNECKN